MTLFPKYLNIDSNGAAVFFLQLLLQAGGYNDSIVADGCYGIETAKGVHALQAELGVEMDGNFGPDTRAAWLKQGGPDINSISIEALTSETIAVDP